MVGRGLARVWTEWEVAHLAFDPARIAAIAAGYDPFLQDFDENGAMKSFTVLRGE